MLAEVLLLEHLIQSTKLHVLDHLVFKQFLDQELHAHSGLQSRRYKSGWSEHGIVRGHILYHMILLQACVERDPKILKATTEL
jgi:hypothetical protein